MSEEKILSLFQNNLILYEGRKYRYLLETDKEFNAYVNIYDDE